MRAEASSNAKALRRRGWIKRRCAIWPKPVGPLLPTEIINYLYVPDEARGRRAASELLEAGYRVEVRPAATRPSWLTLAKIDMVPRSDNITMIRQRFEALASQLGGEYDGWEAAVTN
ncbi:MAG: ribonuclease E inhibitor RraB [Chloroflexi bacterium]|nr:MAG: ribonuclease E inhibitor RraB [Chloroflexota bacterium]